MTWRTASLIDVSTLGPQYGANARALPWLGGRPRYVRITDIDSNGRLQNDEVTEADLDEVNEFLLEEGDLLLARSGNTVGKAYRHSSENGECVFAGYLIRFRPNPQIVDSRFLFYFTQSSAYHGWVLGRKRVAGQPNINGAEYASLKIPIPSLSEQRRIVEILDQADELRKSRARADIKAARILPALFYNIFGDPAINPRRWPIASLEELVEIGTQLVDPNQPAYADLPHIGGEQIEKETGRILSPKSVRDSDLRSAKFLFTADHVLYSKIRPYLNKVAYPRFPGLCSADIYPLRLKDERIGPWYLVALLRSPAFLDYAKLYYGRLRMPKLNRDQLAPFKVPVPERSLVESFESCAQKIAELESDRFHETERIDRLVTVLLHRAFTGELTSRWREAHSTELTVEIDQQAKKLSNPKEASLC